MNKILKKYNVIGDDFFYHHTVTEADGSIYHSSPEVHQQYELMYLIDGRVSYVIEGKSYDVNPGDIIFVAPNEIHTLKIDGNFKYERAVLLFRIDIMKELFRNISVELEQFSENHKNRFHIIRSDLAEKYRLREILFSIIDTDCEEKYKKLLITSRLIEFITQLDKMATDDGASFIRPSSEDELVRRIIDYIDSHIGDKLTLDELAKNLFVSKSTICHRFSAYMNMTVNKYINVRKMHYAAELIQDGHSVAEASRRTGFDNYASFFYNYKRIIGSSPTSSKK